MANEVKCKRNVAKFKVVAGGEIKCCSTLLEIADQFSYFNRDIVCKFMDNSQND